MANLMAKTNEQSPTNAPESRGAHQTVRTAAQRKRSIAIGVSLALLVVLFYIATLIKMSDGFLDKAGS